MIFFDNGFRKFIERGVSKKEKSECPGAQETLNAHRGLSPEEDIGMSSGKHQVIPFHTDAGLRKPNGMIVFRRQNTEFHLRNRQSMNRRIRSGTQIGQWDHDPVRKRKPVQPVKRQV